MESIPGGRGVLEEQRRAHLEASCGMPCPGFLNLSIDIGPDYSLLWDCPVYCRMFSSIPGLCRLDARVPSPSQCDIQKCLQTLVSPGNENYPWFTATGQVGIVIHTAVKVLGYVSAPSARMREDPLPSSFIPSPNVWSHRPGTRRCMLTMYWKGKANTGLSSWKLEGLRIGVRVFGGVALVVAARGR